MLRPNARSPSITSQESYSAVMITDMIADVNVNPELEGTPKSAKEETNLAFDGHMDGEVKSSPLEDVDSTKINGSGISKGVILNAVQFSSNDSKKTFDKTSMQLTATLAAPTMTQPVSEPKGFKDMTLKRKIAFGFSFLPSIFFVLCFAVILPCKVPRQCVEETWIATFNNTEPVSGLELTKKIVLTAFKEGRNVLLQLEKTDGKSEEIELPSSPAYLKCGNVFNESEKDCMVMDESGKIYTFNDTHSKFLWNPISEKENLPPPPLILSGCNEKLEAVVIAVSNTIIKFLLGGNKISNFLITHCDSVPEKMMSWKTGDSSDIAFVCNKDGEDRLVKIPGNAWCDTSQNFPKKTHVLKIGVLDSLRESIIKPLGDDGLALWLGDEVSVIQSNGTLLWKISNFSHPEENRFILHGKFLGENKHLAFISSNLTYGLQVTFLNPSDGSFVKKLNFEKKEALDISHIEGKKGDFVILLLRKFKPTSGTMTAAFTRITDISSTIVSMLSDEKLYEGASGPLAEELSILDQDGNLELVKEIRDVEDSTSKSTMKAIIDEDGALNVYLLSALGNSQMKTTEVKNINVANWDKSLKSKCLAK